MNFLINSDCGDVIYLLPMIKAMGGGNIFFAKDSRDDATTPWQVRLPLLKDLLVTQSYIGIVKYHEGESIDWPTDENKSNCKSTEEQYLIPYGKLMLQNHDLNVNEFEKPWLEVDGEDHDLDVVINRTTRYITSHHHMQELLLPFLNSRAGFVGTEPEWEFFCKTIAPIRFVKTDNLLGLAEVINKAKVFVGNQSCALAIAEGLKKTIVQETCKWIPNCCFSREGFYTFHDTGNYRMIGSSSPLDSFFGVDVEEVEDPITVNITNTPYGLYPYKRLANHFYRMKTYD